MHRRKKDLLQSGVRRGKNKDIVPLRPETTVHNLRAELGKSPGSQTNLHSAKTKKDHTVFILGCMIFLAPAVGVPHEELLQDTLKSMVVSLVALAAALVFFWQQRKRSQPLRWHAVIGFPLLLMAYALGSMAWSHTYLAGAEAIRWFIFAVIVWLGLNSFSRDRLPALAWGIHIGAVVASLWAALQFWIDFNFFAQAAHPASTFVNRNFFAEYVVCTIPFGLWLLTRASSNKQIATLSFTIAFNVLALMMTGTRSALAALWLLLLLVLPIIVIFYRKQLCCRVWRGSQWTLALAIFAGSLVGLGLLNSGNAQVIASAGKPHVSTFERAFKRTASISLEDNSFQQRSSMWNFTARMIKDRPLTGVGAGAWEVDLPLYQDSGFQLESDYYAHNEILQLLAEYGLAGWVTFIGLLTYFCLSTWRSWRNRSQEGMDEGLVRAIALASLLALLIVSNAGFPWRLASTGALFALCLGILAATDARLGIWGWTGAMPLNWRPVFSKLAILALAICLSLAIYISRQAARSEQKLIVAAKLALMISHSGDVNHPRWNRMKKEILGLTREGIEINPHYRKVTPMIADQFANWGDWESATWIWESVVKSRPYIVAMMTNVARGYARMDNYENAFAYLERCQKLQPTAVSVRSLEIILLSRTGQEAQATRLAKKYLAEGSFDYDLVNVASILGVRNGDYELAIQSLELRNKGWPAERVDGFLKLGSIYGAHYKDDAKALAAFRSALDASPAETREPTRQRIPALYRSRL
jgi:O-antigen ligase